MPEFNDCTKRQHEIYKGVERHRCIEKTAEHYRDFVSPEACESCPVRKFARKPLLCNTKPELTSGLPVQLPVVNNPGGQYPECIYRACGQGGCACSISGLSVDPEICNRCDAEVRDKTAGSLDKLQNYFGAVRRWIAAGRPTRTDEEMKKIFDEHCKQCDRYDPKNHACNVCGCSVSTDSKPLSNKLKMATESCPLGRF